jgi:hypothetical protein
MTSITHKNPTWWEPEHDSAWERAKFALKRDWDQTRHDVGGSEPDTGQNIGNTVRQAVGKEEIPPRHEPTFEEIEPALRFGHGARLHYGEDYPEWDDELEAQLKDEWISLDPPRRASWKKDREAIQQGWEYEDE